MKLFKRLGLAVTTLALTISLAAFLSSQALTLATYSFVNSSKPLTYFTAILSKETVSYGFNINRKNAII